MTEILEIFHSNREKLAESALETLLMSSWGAERLWQEHEILELFSGLYRALAKELKANTQKTPGHYLTQYLLKDLQSHASIRNDLHTQLLILGVSRVVLNHFLANTLEMRNQDTERNVFEYIQRIFDFSVINLSQFWGQNYQKLHQKDQILIKELKIVKDDLQQQLNIIYQLIRESPVGVVACDAHWKVEHWNPIAVRLTGYQPADILKKNVFEILTEKTRAIIHDRAISDRKWTSNLEIFIRRKNGDTFPALASLSKIKDTRPNGIFYILNFQDISERAQFQSSVQQLNQLTAISRLSSAIMHDVRNPINSIRLNVDVLEQQLDQGKTIEQQDLRTFVANIHRQVTQLSDHLDHYLTYTHLTHLRISRINLIEELGALVHEVRLDAALRTIQFEATLPAKDYFILGDWFQLRRAFVNLLQNAMEAVTDKGLVRLICQRRAQRIQLLFQDNGPGIHPDQGKKIFEPFYTSKITGIGLGLFITKEIILAHHGRIGFSSQKGSGAQFLVSLPLSEEQKDK